MALSFAQESEAVSMCTDELRVLAPPLPPIDVQMPVHPILWPLASPLPSLMVLLLCKGSPLGLLFGTSTWDQSLLPHSRFPVLSHTAAVDKWDTL